MEKFIKPKPFEELKCSDNFMFAKVMEDPDLCKNVLEVLLGIKIGKLSYPEAEKTIQTAPDTKGIRLDVHTSDGKHEFDIEIQTSHYEDLPKRSRFYQSIMDVDYLLKGNTYSKLKENIVIFICLDDPLKKGLPVYTFENTCRANNSVKLQDKTLKVFYTCSEWQKAKTEDMRQLLKFLLTNNADNDLCKKLEEKEKRVKMTARAYKEYLDYCMLKQEGYEQGAFEKSLEAAKNMLAENIPEDTIVRCTGLPLETVKQLSEKM